MGRSIHLFNIDILYRIVKLNIEFSIRRDTDVIASDWPDCPSVRANLYNVVLT